MSPSQHIFHHGNSEEFLHMEVNRNSLSQQNISNLFHIAPIPADDGDVAMIDPPALSQLLNQLGYGFFSSYSLSDCPDGRRAVLRIGLGRNQHFFVPIAVMGDGRIGQIEDFLRRAVILHQLHDLEIWM